MSNNTKESVPAGVFLSVNYSIGMFLVWLGYMLVSHTDTFMKICGIVVGSLGLTLLLGITCWLYYHLNIKRMEKLLKEREEDTS